MSLRWILLILLFNSLFIKLECRTKLQRRKLNLKEKQTNIAAAHGDSNEILDTKKLKFHQSTTAEKQYNKKFHYYRIKFVFVLSIIVSIITLILNLNYFWSPYTTQFIVNREILKVLEGNIDCFKKHPLFEDFDRTIEKLKEVKESRNKVVITDFVPFQVYKETPKHEEEEKIKENQPPSDNADKSVTVLSLTETSDVFRKPAIRLISDENMFFNKKADKIHAEDNSKVSACTKMYKTEFLSNISVKAPTSTYNIVLSSSSSSSSTDSESNDGKIKLSICKEFSCKKPTFKF